MIETTFQVRAEDRTRVFAAADTVIITGSRDLGVERVESALLMSLDKARELNRQLSEAIAEQDAVVEARASVKARAA